MLKMYLNAMGLMHRFRADESGVTAIEYSLILGAIALAIVSIVFTLGDDLAGPFSILSAAIQDSF